VGQADAGDIGANGPEITANFGGGAGLVIPQIVMRHAAKGEDEDAIDIAPARSGSLGSVNGLQAEDLGQAQATDSSQAQESSPINTVAKSRHDVTPPLQRGTPHNRRTIFQTVPDGLGNPSYQLSARTGTHASSRAPTENPAP